jgi:tetratricopeptide (TPR) repeat protein
VVVVGDHGELLGEHGELTHTYFVYHNAVRVPLIMRIPGIAGGQRVSGAVGLVDVAPTLCGLFNLPSPESDGRDLAPLLRGEAEGESERPLYCESLTPTRYGANPLRAVTTSSWKFIRSNRPELYDLAQDPEEAVNLVDERAGEMQRLQNILSGMVASEAGFEADADIGVDSETARQLAALGYMSSALDTDVDLDPRRPDPKDFIELHVAHQRTFLAMADGRWDEAEAACLEVLEGLPEFYEAVGNLAKIRVGQRRWGESLPLLERALELKPDQYEIIHDQGLALTEVGDLAGAVEAFRRAVALDPSPPTAELNLSRALFNVGALEEGLAHAETVAQHAAENPDMLRLLAELLLDHGQVAEAVPVLERVVALAPEDLETRNTLGLIMVSSGNLDVARRQYEAMVEIDPGSADAHLNLGMIILQQRQDEMSLRAAAVHFSRAAQLDPSLPAAHLNLAFANIRLGRTEEGIAGLRRTLDLVPDQPEVQDQLARLLITAADPSLRNPSEARDLAERACAISGYREPSFMATLAAAHAASGDTPRAAAVADRALGLAREQGRPELVRQLESDLASYR